MKLSTTLLILGTLMVMAGVFLVAYQIANVGTPSEAPDYFIPLGFSLDTLGLIALLVGSRKRRSEKKER